MRISKVSDLKNSGKDRKKLEILRKISVENKEDFKF